MSFNHDEFESSDDEIFFGPITLKEIKKRLLPVKYKTSKNRQTIACAITQISDNLQESIKIIETHSAPDITSGPITSYTKLPFPKLQSVSNPSLPSREVDYTWDANASDDSFLIMEKMVANMNLSQTNDGTLNALEFVNGPPKDISIDIVQETQITATDYQPVTNNTPDKNIANKEETEVFETPSKDLKPKFDMISNSSLLPFVTPSKNLNKPGTSRIPETVSAASNNIFSVFKTPRNPILQSKSVSSLKKTPSKLNAYQHIKSPIATYIKNSPQVPFVTDVRPKKPLGSSSIPKFVKTSTTKVFNKENVNLPALAYRNAKTTRVVDMHTEHKLPRSVTKPRNIISSLPKPVVMKHHHREINLTRRVLMPQQEDSFNDLSLHQADVSVCIQKPAFNMP